MRKALAIMMCMGCMGGALAQNPIIRDRFTADPTARVFNGKVYLFPSHDIKAPDDYPRKDWFCMNDYHVYSSENLTDWEDHGVILSQQDVPWGNPKAYSMWAPDCVEKGGKYYFYFPDVGKPPKRGFGIGVAIAEHPEGPYIPMDEPIANIMGIDPCVLVDDDGKSYLYYAMGGKIYGAQLQDNMTEPATDTTVMQGLPDGFKEGPFVFKRNNIYYLTMPWVRTNTETLAYAMSDNPLGPFQFKGLIMEESPSGCWTNHHSLVEYKGVWYLFYHHNDYSPGFDKLRSTRIDTVTFNDDGTINPVRPTLRGVGITPAFTTIQIDRYSGISQGAAIAHLDTANTFLGWKTVFEQPGSHVDYDNVYFSKAAKGIILRATAPEGARLRVVAGSRTKEIDIPATSVWKETDAPFVMKTTGTHRVRVELVRGKVSVDWIRFR